jgi:hypothetical protein
MGLFSGEKLAYDEYLQQLQRIEMEREKHTEAQKVQYGQIMNASHQRRVGQGVQPQKVPRFDPNKSEAFQIPLSQLVTLWRLKHGEEWADMSRPRPPSGKDFYTDAFDRLDKADMFEMFDGWCRLKEDV